MSEITWAGLVAGEQQGLRLIANKKSIEVSFEFQRRLHSKGFVAWDYEEDMLGLTDLGRAVLAQAEKLTTITAQEFVANGYEAKIAAGECVVKSILYTKFEVVSVEQIKPNSDGWDVAITDTKSTYRTWSNAKLTVTWLPQQADSGATGAKNAQVEAGDSLPPVTQEEINAYLKSQGQDPATLADAFRPAIEKVIRERQKILDELVAPVAKEEKRGLALEWVFGFDGALACLELVANGSTWQSWQQHRTDTRGIVTERAGKYLRKQQAELASAKAEAGRLRAALEGCKADCTLSMIYVGDFYRDATKRVKARVAAALQAGTEGG